MAWNEERGFWAVTRHADVRPSVPTTRPSAPAGGSSSRRSGRPTTTPPTMMHADPPAHTRYRRLVQPGFKPSVVRALEPAVRARARALVERHRARRRRSTWSRRSSVPLPLQVIGEIMGLPDGGLGALLRVVRGGHPRGHRLARGAAAPPAQAEMIELPPRRGQGPPRPPRGRRAHRAGPGRGRRGPAERRRAGHVPGPAAGGRERDDPQPHQLGGLVAFADHPGQWERLAGRPVASCRARWRRCCGGPPRWSPSCARPPATPSCPAWPSPPASPCSCCLRLGQPGRGRSSGPTPCDLRRRPRPQPPHRLRLRQPLLPGRRPGPARGPGRPRGAARPVRRSCAAWPGGRTRPARR